MIWLWNKREWTQWSEPYEVVLGPSDRGMGRIAVIQTRTCKLTGIYEYREVKGLRGLPKKEKDNAH